MSIWTRWFSREIKLVIFLGSRQKVINKQCSKLRKRQKDEGERNRGEEEEGNAYLTLNPKPRRGSCKYRDFAICLAPMWKYLDWIHFFCP